MINLRFPNFSLQFLFECKTTHSKSSFEVETCRTDVAINRFDCCTILPIQVPSNRTKLKLCQQEMETAWTTETCKLFDNKRKIGCFNSAAHGSLQSCICFPCSCFYLCKPYFSTSFLTKKRKERESDAILLLPIPRANQILTLHYVLGCGESGISPLLRIHHSISRVFFCPFLFCRCSQSPCIILSFLPNVV